jgi:anti-sigma regulatory factor (Ser/Thr protein kinase)
VASVANLRVIMGEPRIPQDCTPPATLRFGSLPKLLAALAVPKAGGDLVVNLRALRWIEPLPIAVLVAFLRDHRNRFPETKNSIAIPPKYGYLQRMDFFKAVGAKLEEDFSRQDASGRFVPVREVSGTADVAVAAEEIVSTLRLNDKDAARTLRHCVGEIVDNVFVHSRSPVNAVVCAQHFPNACRSQVAIVDRGIGFRASFSENPDFTAHRLKDVDALRLGMAPFVTSKPSSSNPYQSGYGRLGVGLYIVASILKQVGGRLTVVSGRAAVVSRKRGVVWSEMPEWQGTIVGFEIPDALNVSYDAAASEARREAREEANARSGV